MKLLEKLSDKWSDLVGLNEDLEVGIILFHALGLVTLGLLLLLSLFNLLIHLTFISLLLFLGAILQAVLFYISRYHHRHVLAVIIYAIFSYVLLILNFFYNEGSNGPTLLWFFVTLHLLISFSPSRFHVLWLTIHCVIGASLLIIEFKFPQLIPQVYQKEGYRPWDIGVTYISAMGFIFFVITFLVGSIRQKRNLAEERATILAKQKESLQQLDFERNKLFSIISHDLRGPLSNIQGFLELLGGTKLSAEEVEKYRRQLYGGVMNTRQMLDNLLLWSRENLNHKKEERLTLCDARILLEDALASTEVSAQFKSITLHNEVQKACFVLADGNYLSFIFRNLLSNAIKFTPKGGVVSICCREEKDRLIFIIKDSGIGIPNNIRKTLFTPLTTSQKGTSNEKGTGLGLLVCKEFVDKLKGDIWFESEENEGTSFFVAFSKTSPQPPEV